MTLRPALLAAAVSLTLVAGGAQAVADEIAPTTCTGVWVAVGAQAARCAEEHTTGRAALESAGFALAEKSPGFLCQIDGIPETCEVRVDAYWSSWQAARNPDGSWGPWVYASVGYADSAPAAGDAEGWVLGDGKAPPPPLPDDPAPLVRVEPVRPADPGSPAGTLATAGIVGVGGIALGGWWLWRRRTS